VSLDTALHQCLENLFSSSSSSSSSSSGGGGGGSGGGGNSSAFRSQVTPGDPIGLC
jgi:uncharacterized membrane protein